MRHHTTIVVLCISVIVLGIVGIVGVIRDAGKGR